MCLDRALTNKEIAERLDLNPATALHHVRTLVATAHIPGNVLDEGSWKAVVYIDDGATEKQQEALLKVWTGQLGGPVADLAKLIGEVVTVERAPITFTVTRGKGTLRVGNDAEPALEAELAPYEGATGKATTLADTVFSTIPGSPAYVSKAPTYRRRSSQYGLADVNLHNHNAVQGNFSFIA